MTAAVCSAVESARREEYPPTGELEPSPPSLVGVVQDLSLARDMPAIMEIVRKAARELTGADGATFVLRDGDLCYYAEENAIEPLWKGRRFPMSACISGWAMLHGEAVTIEDIYDDPRIPVDAYRPTFVKSLCMVPIRTKAPIGAIGNYWACRHRATPRELSLLQALADSTSVAMENVAVYAELEKRVRDRTRELEERSRELAAEHAALLEAQRQKEALSALVVHDLKSPAAAIALAASVQLRSADLKPADRRRWGIVFSSAERIIRTAASVLDIAQSQDGRLVPQYADIELCGLLAEIREVVLPLAEKREQTIELSCNVPAGALRADRDLLGRTLQNLVDNALRYSPAQSTVRLEARADAAWVTIAVCDEGPGVPVEMRERIFDQYVRLEENARSGWGLGLSFCKMAVEAHGGASWIEDNTPRGSRFCFKLPVAPGKSVLQGVLLT
ncbi:ATP-binding protein [Polyangium sp. 6x1]|uniref:GAF domain-containing sensor histidine kinase n=1 Tax=Polyangium sp. 6x1 TaxID=3042689 RepID=UPI002482CADD|nr:ATP-binding protein [Polyangium sp. 6x1]MDI1449036.1 ATP-binding protein [Polyangium sp. 6x1]